MSARDRKEWDLGQYLLSEQGPDAFRDACGDDLVYAIGDLAKCGDEATIGRVLLRYMLAHEGIQKAIAAEREAAEAQRELFSTHEDQFPSWERFTSRDPETGIACRGEI